MKTTLTKIWSITWRVLLSLTMVAVIIFVILLYRVYEYRYSYSEHEYYLTSSQSVKVKQTDYREYQTIDAKTGKALTPKLHYIYTGIVHDSLTVFEDRHSRRGFLNVYTGRIQIPARWEHAWVFSEGVGAVVENNRLGFIDHNGNYVIHPQFGYATDGVEHVFKGGLCTVKDTCGFLGCIDHTGNWVIPPMYNNIQRTKYGYRELRKGDLYGLMDSCGNVLLDCVYDRIQVVDSAIILAQSGRQWMVSTDLQTTIRTSLFDDQSYFTNEYDDYGTYTIAWRYGLMDRTTGRLITPAIYENIYQITDDLYDCVLTSEWGYAHILINAKGEIVKQP